MSKNAAWIKYCAYKKNTSDLICFEKLCICEKILITTTELIVVKSATKCL